MSTSPLPAVDLPVLAAPMAGGPSTPGLVIAAASSGAFGFLAAGYRSVEALAADVEAVSARTESFGVNLFVPNPVPVDRAAYDRYRAGLSAAAGSFGVTLPAEPVENDDAWRNKIDLLLARPVPVVSFTFGLPAATELDALRRVGSVLVQTVTSADEARAAAAAGVDVLAVQATAAGGHSGTWTPARVAPDRPLLDLLAEVRAAVALPIVAAGGLGTAAQVAAAIRAGATAAVVGTALLRADESGSSPAHRAALADHDRDTVVTRAFTGRPARGLRNAFITEYDAAAPLGYPALHYLTSPLRRASVAAVDPEYVNVWAGTGYRHAIDAPAGELLHALAAEL